MEDNVKLSKYMVSGLIGLTLVLMASLGVADNPETQTINRAVIKIDTLSCGGCFSTISAGLNPMEGYSGMGTNLFRKLIAIDFIAPLTQEKISEKLVEVGYPGTIEDIGPISEKESFAYLESKRTGFASGGGGGCCSGGAPGVGAQGNSSCPYPGAAPQTEDL